MSLLAQEISTLQGNSRYYEGFYTFEKEITYELISILSQIYPREIPKPIKLALLSGY